MFTIKTPLDLSACGRSGFLALLSLLNIRPPMTVLDVGAGGNDGEYTTDPLLNLGVTLIGINPTAATCARMREKHADRIEMIEGSYGQIRVNRPVDLVVIDIRPTHAVLDEMLEFVAIDDLRPGGYVFCVFLLNVTAFYKDVQSGVGIEEKSADEEFNLRFFGAIDLDVEVVSRRFARHPHFELVAVADRFFGYNNLQWLVLRRRARGWTSRIRRLWIHLKKAAKAEFHRRRPRTGIVARLRRR